MSSHIVAAVVCEGQTDYPIISGMVKRLWPDVAEVRCLQPELDETCRAKGDAGWTEVKRWCTQYSGSLGDLLNPDIGDPISLLVVAIDVDIAARAGLAGTNPGAYDTVRLQKVMRCWCGGGVPTSVVFSTPAMAIETWVVAALFSQRRNPEAIHDPAAELRKRGKLRASKNDGKPWKELHIYTGSFAKAVSGKLSRVRKSCKEAERTCGAIESVRDSWVSTES